MQKSLCVPVIVVLAVLSIGSGCASSGSSGERSDRTLITRAELEGMDHLSAFDAIRRLRPAWLQAERGQDSFTAQGRRGTRVYLDGTPYGDKSALNGVVVRTIETIRFLDKRRATTRFGTDHGEGAILIETRSG